MNDFIKIKLYLLLKIENNFILSAMMAHLAESDASVIREELYFHYLGLPLGDWYTNFLSSTGISDTLAVGLLFVI
ncbi:MAG: hypothetical protein ACLRWM_09415 [Streptococcus sp.]